MYLIVSLEIHPSFSSICLKYSEIRFKAINTSKKTEMEYKGGSTGFIYNLTTLHEVEKGGEGNNFSSLLDIYAHEALNLHNICIYANQDVYAKFSLTSSPDEALSTRVVASGGNSPRFNEQLPPLRYCWLKNLANFGSNYNFLF